MQKRIQRLVVNVQDNFLFSCCDEIKSKFTVGIVVNNDTNHKINLQRRLYTSCRPHKKYE